MPPQPKGNRAQRQPITTTLRNLIRDYPGGGGVLRELCQNADDAGATCIEFVLDKRTHTKEPLLHQDLRHFQGPAVLSYNDQIFLEKDFVSLSNIGDSEKAKDMNSTGKFGRGFNSVYNWTDNPSILTGRSLLLLDPHETWSDGGPDYDFVKDHDDPAMRNQLEAFNSLVESFDKPFKGTVIRLPLRKSEPKSKIVPDKETNIQEIETIFQKYADEAVESLLFLRNIRSIKIRIGVDRTVLYAESRNSTLKHGDAEQHGNTDESFRKINDLFRDVLTERLQDSANYSFIKEIKFSDEIGQKKCYQFAITHYMAKDLGPENEDILSWARKHKMFPWVAVATPLNWKNPQGCRLFTTLPLPINTKHPFHIHGLLSTTPDRARIHTGEDSSISENAEPSLGAIWNKILFQKCVVPACIENLELISSLNRHQENEFYGGWNSWPTGPQDSTDGFDISRLLLKEVINKDLKLLPTILRNLTTPRQCLYSDNLESSLESALEDAEVPLVFPKSRPDIIKEFTTNRAFVSSDRKLSPQKIRTHLNGKMHLEALKSESKEVLLKYIISDKNYSDLGGFGFPIVPLADSTYGMFAESDSQLPIMLSMNTAEHELFSKHPAEYRVDFSISRMASTVLKQLRKDINDLAAFTNISRWDLGSAAAYCGTFANHNGTNSNHSATEVLNVVDFWKWALEICTDEPLLILSFSGLWIVPIMNKRYFKVDRSSPKSILDVSGSGGISLFFKEIINSSPSMTLRYYFLEDSLPEVVKNFFHRNLVVDCESLAELLEWLTSVPVFFQEIDRYSSRQNLVSELLSMQKRNFGSNATHICGLFKKLPLFRRPCDTPPEWISIGDTGIKYVGINSDIITVASHLSHHGTIFIDVHDDCKEQRQLIDELKLIDRPNVNEIISDYVIPMLNDSNHILENMSHKQELCKFALNHLDNMSQEHRNILGGIAFVSTRYSDSPDTIMITPRELVDPESDVAMLYFLDESRFPDSYFTKFGQRLRSLGMITKHSVEVVVNRVRTFSERSTTDTEEFKELTKKIQLIFTQFPNPIGFSESQLRQLCELRWIPASTPSSTVMNPQLWSPSECRDGTSKSYVGYALPLTNLKIGYYWRELFGWLVTPPKPILLKQIDGIIKNKDNQSLKVLLRDGHLNGVFNDLADFKWIPGSSGNWFRPKDVFFDHAENLSPYADIVHHDVYALMGESKQIRRAPSLNKIQEIQDLLLQKEGPLDEDNLKISFSLINIYTQIPISARKEAHGFLKAPDKHGRLHDLNDLTYDPEDSSRLGGENYNILHPKLNYLARNLAIPSAEERELVSLTHGEPFVQEEDLIVSIKDTLLRYPVDSTFTEYLANAEDCGTATKIAWVIDHGEYPTKRLLDKRLHDVQGKAMFCYNDGHFSEEDFRAVIRVGVGSKRQDDTKLGRFGRGALTMYHWTTVPSFISGKYFVIFDPEKKRLPKDWAGLKLPISDLRQKYPDQLAPFEGLFGFDNTTTDFKGTLFRFPSVGTGRNCTEFSLKRQNIKNVKDHLSAYYSEAKISLIFLTKITSIEFFDRKPKYNTVAKDNWKVSIEREREKLGRSHKASIRTEHIPLNEKFDWILRKAAEEPHLIPDRDNLKDIREECRLETRYGVAAPLFDLKSASIDPRVFMDLPLKFVKSGLPVFITADMVIHNNRQSILLETSDGAAWNRWILGEEKLVPLYISLLEDIANGYGSRVYDYWPSGSSESFTTSPISDPISAIVSDAFWNKVTKSSCRLFPRTRYEDSGSSADGTDLATISTYLKPLKPSEAIFDFLDPGLGNVFNPIFRHLGHENIVRVHHGNAYEGLKKRTDVKKISPEMVRDVLSSKEDMEALHHAFAFNELDRATSAKNFTTLMNLMFIFAKSNCSEDLSEFKRCYVPLEDGNIGQLLADIDSDVSYLSSHGSIFDATLLEMKPECSIHHDFDNNLIEALISNENLKFNIETLDWTHIPKLVESFEKHTFENRQLALQKIWTGFNQMTKEEWTNDQYVHELLLPLENLPVYVVKSAPNIRKDFITIREFDIGLPVVIENTNYPPKDAKFEDFQSCFQDLITIGAIGLPRYLTENTEKSGNDKSRLHRLLRSIQKIAQSKNMSLGHYFTESVRRHVDARGYESYDKYMEELVSVIFKFVYTDTKDITDFKDLLILLPIWKVQDSESDSIKWMSGTDVMRTPDTKIDWSSVANSGNFLPLKWQNMHKVKLNYLGVRTCSKDYFLQNHMPTSHVSQNKLQAHHRFLKSILNSSDHRSILEHHPVFLDGGLRCCKLGALYNHKSNLYTAAFRQDPEKSTKFLHRELQDLEWIIFPTDRPETPSECAAAIDRRWLKECVDQELFNDAKIVFNHLSSIRDQFDSTKDFNFVPVTSNFNFNYREERQLELLPKKNITTLKYGAPQDYSDISWSQLPIFLSPLGLYTESMPLGGGPSPVIVARHIEYLSTHVPDEQISQYVKDVKSSYRYLQELEYRQISKTDRIWLNLDIDVSYDYGYLTSSQIRDSWVDASSMVLNPTYEIENLQEVGAFLAPFNDLLVASGVKRVRQLDRISAPELPESHAENLYVAIKKFRHSSNPAIGPDFALVMNDGTVRGHRLILASVSPYFESLFSLHQWTEQTLNEVRLDGFTCDTIQRIVDYIYDGTLQSLPGESNTGTCTGDPQNELLKLLEACNYFLMPELMAKVEYALRSYVRPDTVMRIWSEATEYNAKNLIKSCEEFIRKNSELINDN